MMLTLPWPPTVDTYWRKVPGLKKPLISKRGREYKRAVADEIWRLGIRPIRGRLHVSIDCFPPDLRERDLDNLPKAILDALQEAGVYRKDSDIDYLMICRHKPDRPKGHIEIVIESLQDMEAA